MYYLNSICDFLSREVSYLSRKGEEFGDIREGSFEIYKGNFFKRYIISWMPSWNTSSWIPSWNASSIIDETLADFSQRQDELFENQEFLREAMSEKNFTQISDEFQGRNIPELKKLKFNMVWSNGYHEENEAHKDLKEEALEEAVSGSLKETSFPSLQELTLNKEFMEKVEECRLKYDAAEDMDSLCKANVFLLETAKALFEKENKENNKPYQPVAMAQVILALLAKNSRKTYLKILASRAFEDHAYKRVNPGARVPQNVFFSKGKAFLDDPNLERLTPEGGDFEVQQANHLIQTAVQSLFKFWKEASSQK